MSTKSSQDLGSAVYTCAKESLGSEPPVPFLFWETLGALKSNSAGLKSISTLGQFLSLWAVGFFICGAGFAIVCVSMDGHGDETCYLHPGSLESRLARGHGLVRVGS